MFDVFYLNYPTGLFAHERRASSLQEACELSRTRYLWIVDGCNDYSTFDWCWEPVPWQSHQTHVWPSQHQENSGTYLVPKSGASEINRNHSIVTRSHSATIIGIDHGDGLTVECDIQSRYISDYLGTLKRILSKIDQEYVWVVSSVCDYTNFDFTWHPSEWQQDMLHVFASNDQKFGDTFYVHVPSFLAKSKNLELLEWFDTINFVSGIVVPRKALPVIYHADDTHVDVVRRTDWPGPLAVFTVDTVPVTLPTVSLWRNTTKNIVPLSAGASAVIVPRAAKTEIKTQLYDYPFIDKTEKKRHSDRLQNVVFISNGESMAEQNWHHLVSICPRARRSDGVTGRERAYKAAAELSSTPWFYAVFAKTEVYPTFEFDFQPDRMQQPKHYIFHSRNPLNGLEYGAMNVNLYNRQLVLDTQPGIDFTLSAAHEVVPMCISTTRFNTDPWVTWRSAFREVLKLKLEVDQGADVEIQYRLNTWLTVANGDNAEWCLAGGQDAINYYTAVNSDYEKLSLSFDWQWLQDYYYSLYHTRPWLEL
jgi:hypothetical protein